LAIRGAAELLLAGAGGPLGATARELLAASGEAALRLERLVEPVLRVAERAGGPARRPETVDLQALLTGAGVELGGRATRAAHRGGVGPIEVRAEPGCFLELVELAATILGRPLRAELRRGKRTGALLLTFEGTGPQPCREDERPLLAGLAARLARLAGGRLVAGAEDRVGILLRPATGPRPARKGRRGPLLAAPAGTPPGRGAACR
jgi:signal transduction histidine kinase